MLNENLFLLSFEELQRIAIHDLTIFDCALAYVLVYVVYKALGRYIYFKPEEHASKINRTFLVISLTIISLHFLRSAASYLPFSPEHLWLYAVCGLALLVAPLSIITSRLVWKYHGWHNISRRDWTHRYMPIPRDFYKTSVDKSSRDGSVIHSWEEEGVESTSNNLHSDMLLNLIALTVFLVTGTVWSLESASVYGWYSIVIFAIISLWVTAVFLDRGVFAWIDYCELKIESWIKKYR